ncbi:SCO2522 family protein [Cryptosporangium minutisporangium]|uniref:SCO2522 family protein n=1 Tax=Cryptosporangium minutisporangium TaxID=113569 RepID=A0ABP6TCK1_9ACTN
MSPVKATHSEAAGALRPVASVPLSHVSIEVGHLYMEDFAPGQTDLTAYFRRLAPWVKLGTEELTAGQKRPRVSTCFLVDDYFRRSFPPGAVLPAVIDAAAEAGLTIDYIARESACAEAGGVPLAPLVRSRLVAEPPAGTNGSRPPVTEVGWLSNGMRSPSTGLEAMQAGKAWQPPTENAARNHSVFMDIELWSGDTGAEKWSCAYLAAVWQLLRLGVLRFEGKPVTALADAPASWPDSWDDVPPVVRLNERADPFSAYRTLSVMTNRFLATEHAVRTILGQVEVDPAVLRDVDGRAENEQLALPREIIERISYVFLGGGPLSA